MIAEPLTQTNCCDTAAVPKESAAPEQVVKACRVRLLRPDPAKMPRYGFIFGWKYSWHSHADASLTLPCFGL